MQKLLRMTTHNVEKILYHPSNLEHNGICIYIAQCAQLAMSLEVSATPKPGNIDRDHDFDDTKYEHFLASSISVFPTIFNLCTYNKGLGESIYSGVLESLKWQRGGNTHFGAYVLLVPLAAAIIKMVDKEKEFTLQQLLSCASHTVENTDIVDSINFYNAFNYGNVRVKSVNEFDLKNSESIDQIKNSKLTLFDLMQMSKNRDLLANEWVNGFKRCGYASNLICESFIHPMNILKEKEKNINYSIIYTFLKLLSEYNDTFITIKHNSKVSENVSIKARYLVQKIDDKKQSISSIIPELNKFDQELLEQRINPGSTADIIVAGLFISLFGGLRF
ncbi:triphosphoribosyl-dephospho-CoA synthase [Methanosalsum natronophilum]|uniref:triphosphoribosyl-dephospho-CoA synthase n=1 Tax=Methanosalsum natronophilum TaxID=768733 RepID=UPI00216788D3|nr:triphosphoribosyl-dephospho-CoA synthase [Methanosalsum natronophilum]